MAKSFRFYLRGSLTGLIRFFSCVLLFLIVISCGTMAPIMERDNAEKEIESAREVDAELYAEEEFGEAVENFETGNELIVLEKKSKQNSKAKSKYLDAIDFAKRAYAKSIKPYLTALIEETTEIIDQAEEDKKDTASVLEAREKNQLARESLDMDVYEEGISFTMEAREIVDNAEAFYREVEYVVNRNDSLWKIAKNKLGDPLRWIEIYKRNIDEIKDFNLIYPGQKLFVVLEGGEDMEQFSFVEQTDENIHVVLYKLGKKQSLWLIAEQKLGSGRLWKQIYELNKDKVEDPNIIYPGQKIVIRK